MLKSARIFYKIKGATMQRNIKNLKIVMGGGDFSFCNFIESKGNRIKLTLHRWTRM